MYNSLSSYTLRLNDPLIAYDHLNSTSIIFIHFTPYKFLSNIHLEFVNYFDSSTSLRSHSSYILVSTFIPHSNLLLFSCLLVHELTSSNSLLYLHVFHKHHYSPHRQILHLYNFVIYILRIHTYISRLQPRIY